MELFFIVIKINADQWVNNIQLQVKNKRLKKYNFWMLTEEEKSLPDIIFGKFLEQQEPKETIGSIV